MDEQGSKQGHRHSDATCDCDTCRRWDDEDTVSLTEDGRDLLEELAAAAQQGEEFSGAEVGPLPDLPGRPGATPTTAH